MGRPEIPSSWESLPLSGVEGVVLVVGATDTGKTTVARFLYKRLSTHHERVAFVDGDMGQSALGAPTTMTVAVGRSGEADFPPGGPRSSVFVGDISPTGHMLPTVVGAHKLVEQARAGGASSMVFDTTGLVAPSQGGGALKLALVDLLQPSLVVGLQRGRELEHLLVPLRYSKRTWVVDRGVAEAVRRRDVEARHRHREEQYRLAFRGAERLEVTWAGRAIIPGPSFSQHRLVALEDEAGFVMALGIVTGCDRESGVTELYTPLRSLEGVDAIHVGDVVVDPETFRDRRLQGGR